MQVSGRQTKTCAPEFKWSNGRVPHHRPQSLSVGKSQRLLLTDKCPSLELLHIAKSYIGMINEF